MSKLISGLYAFFQWDFKEGVIILTTGKTENKDARESDYKVTNANISFDYWKPVNINFLHKEEKKFQKELHNSGLKYWKTSLEQFIVGNTKEDFEKAEKILLESLKKVKTKSNKHKNVQYEFGCLIDENGNIGGTFDIRDLRKKCDLIPGEEAMIVNKAGINERTRKYLTKYRKEGRRLVECEPHYVNVSNIAWDIIQIVQKNERYGKENIIQNFDSEVENVLG